MDKYGYIGIETLLNFCENSKDHSVTPNDFMRMKRVRMPERKKGKWILVTDSNGQHFICDHCGEWRYRQNQKFCGECGADMRGEQE